MESGADPIGPEVDRLALQIMIGSKTLRRVVKTLSIVLAGTMTVLMAREGIF